MWKKKMKKKSGKKSHLEKKSHNRVPPQQFACDWIRSKKFLTIGYQDTNRVQTLSELPSHALSKSPRSHLQRCEPRAHKSPHSEGNAQVATATSASGLTDVDGQRIQCMIELQNCHDLSGFPTMSCWKDPKSTCTNTRTTTTREKTSWEGVKKWKRFPEKEMSREKLVKRNQIKQASRQKKSKESKTCKKDVSRESDDKIVKRKKRWGNKMWRERSRKTIRWQEKEISRARSVKSTTRQEKDMERKCWERRMPRERLTQRKKCQEEEVSRVRCVKRSRAGGLLRKRWTEENAETCWGRRMPREGLVKQIKCREKRIAMWRQRDVKWHCVGYGQWLVQSFADSTTTR